MAEYIQDSYSSARSFLFSNEAVRRQLREVESFPEGTFPYPLALLVQALAEFDQEYQQAVAEHDETYNVFFS